MNEDYFQPDFYHFSEDSIELSKVAITKIENCKEITILDACCGCGVVGIEIARKVKINNLVLCELQDAYVEYISKNLEKFKIDGNVQVFSCNIKNFKLADKFDLITINPPYFEAQSSRRSRNEFKNLCRIYNKGELLDIFLKIISLLKVNGKIVFSIREHGLDEIEESVKLSGRKISKEKSLNSASIFIIS